MCVSKGTSVKRFLDKNLFESITERKAYKKTHRRYQTELRLKNFVTFTSDYIIINFIQYQNKFIKTKHTYKSYSLSASICFKNTCDSQ